MPEPGSIILLAQARELTGGQFAVLACSAAALYVATRFAGRARSSANPEKLWVSTWPIVAVALAMVLIGRAQAAILLCLASGCAVLSIGLAISSFCGLPPTAVSRRVYLLLPVVVVAWLALRLPRVELIHATALLAIGLLCAWEKPTPSGPFETPSGPFEKPGVNRDLVAVLVTAVAIGLGGGALWVLDTQYRVPADTVLAVFILAPVCALALVMDDLQRASPTNRASTDHRTDAAIAFAIRLIGIALPTVLLLAAVRPRFKTWVELPPWLMVESQLTLPTNAIRFVPLLVTVTTLLLVYRWRGGTVARPEGLLFILGYVTTLIWTLS